jgi:hypothetical protein
MSTVFNVACVNGPLGWRRNIQHNRHSSEWTWLRHSESIIICTTTLSISIDCNYAEWHFAVCRLFKVNACYHYAECHNVIMLNFINHNVIVQNVKMN